MDIKIYVNSGLNQCTIDAIIDSTNKIIDQTPEWAGQISPIIVANDDLAYSVDSPDEYLGMSVLNAIKQHII